MCKVAELYDELYSEYLSYECNPITDNNGDLIDNISFNEWLQVNYKEYVNVD